MITATAEFIAANTPTMKPILAFEIVGYSRVFTSAPTGVTGHYPWLNSNGTTTSGVSDLKFNVSELDGSSSIDDLTVSVLDKGHAITADYPGIVLEGRICHLKTGFVGLAYDKWLTLFVGKVDTIGGTPGMANTSYDFICKDIRLDLQKVIYLTGDSGLPTDNSNPKTVRDNPMEIIKSVLLTYLGLDSSLVDSAAFDAYRDTQFAGAELEFSITSPPDAKTFLESQIFKPLGGYLRTNNLGKLTPVFFIPLPGTVAAVASFDHSNLTLSQSSAGSAGSGVPEIQQQPLTNVISFRYDKSTDSGSAYNSETVLFDDDSIAKYGQQGQTIIEADGVRSGFQGWLLAAFTSVGLFGRYGDKNPATIISEFWKNVCVESGDLVHLTSPLAPNRQTGTLGITNALFQVSTRTLHFDDFTVELELIDATYMLKYGNYRYAPDVTPDWTLATIYEKNRYMFISDGTGKYSDGSDGHATA